MPLTGSGAISLNEIHVEAGGTSGTTCTINDSDIRGLIGKGSGATMSFNEWYGASAFTTVSGTYRVYTGAQASDYSFRAEKYTSTDSPSYDIPSAIEAGILCYPNSNNRIEIYGFGRYYHYFGSGNIGGNLNRYYYRNTSGTSVSSGTLSNASSNNVIYHTYLLWYSSTNAGTGWTITIGGGNSSYSNSTYMNGASAAASATSFNGTKGGAIRASTVKTVNGYGTSSDTTTQNMTVVLTKSNHTTQSLTFDIQAYAQASAIDDDD